MPCLIVSCFVMLACCLLDASSFLKENGGAVDLGKRKCRGELGGVGEGKCLLKLDVFNK